MNKYLSVFRTSFKQESKAFANSLYAVISFCVIIYIFSQLWGYIYGGSGVGSILNGYTFSMMLWYLIIAEVITFAVSPRVATRSVSDDIKSGKVAYTLNKPYNFFGYQISTQISLAIWKLCFLLPAGLVMGLILAGPIQSFSAFYIVPILFSIMIATSINCIIYTSVGLLSFWVEESAPFTWIIQKFMLVLGLFFPLEFFPSWVQPIILYSPIYAIYTGPSKLIANFSWELFGLVTASQIGYAILISCIGFLLYRLGIMKVNINGG